MLCVEPHSQLSLMQEAQDCGMNTPAKGWVVQQRHLCTCEADDACAVTQIWLTPQSQWSAEGVEDSWRVDGFLFTLQG